MEQYVQVEVYQNILRLRCWPLAFILYKAFVKTNRGLELVILSHFLHDFRKKYFSRYIPLTDQIS